MYQKQKILPRFSDFKPRQKLFRDEVLQGLQSTRKTLPSKYFYDAVGSQLFESICELDEYYLTRTELAIMRDQAAEIAATLGPQCLLIEYGSGNSAKTRLLLDVLRAPAGYLPIDIAREQLLRSAASLALAYPEVEVLPVCADYLHPFELPSPGAPVRQRVVYFPGSTIGNFERESAKRFLQHLASVCQGGGLLIGVDLKKDCTILHRAYNDSQGVTAQFNKHLLARINQELGANFQLDQFGHYAFYHPEQGRVEMHLVSSREQQVLIDGVDICFKPGESIWTESSHKYTLEEFAHLAAAAGFSVERIWTDPQGWFSVQYLTGEKSN